MSLCRSERKYLCKHLAVKDATFIRALSGRICEVWGVFRGKKLGAVAYNGCLVTHLGLQDSRVIDVGLFHH